MLPDLLRDNLTLVFCGTAAGNKSAQLKQYYAKPGNKFWKVLYEVGLIPVQLEPPEYLWLLNYGIGLTKIYAATSTSGAANGSWDLRVWQALASLWEQAA